MNNFNIYTVAKAQDIIKSAGTAVKAIQKYERTSSRNNYKEAQTAFAKLFYVTGFGNYNSRYYLKLGSIHYVSFEYGDHGNINFIWVPTASKAKEFISSVFSKLQKEAIEEAYFIKNTAPYWGIKRYNEDLMVATLYRVAFYNL